MVMGYEDVRTVDTGLVLGLGYGGSCSGAAAAGAGAGRPRHVELVKVSGSSLRGGSNSTETSLTLGRQFVGEQRSGPPCPSSPQSMASSLSNNLPSANVKRTERDAAGDPERAMSSRTSDEDEDASAKKKLRLTKEQSALLEERFKEHSTLNPKQKMGLAKQLNLRPRQVEVWFQNRRARTKLKQTEADCQLLKRCCESLTDENRRLHRELQQLKAIKLANPLYVQMPGAATLTLCPSCEKINRANAGDNSNKEASTIVDVAPKPHLYGSLSRSSSSAAC